jgi:preprotein translocase subunit YajC
VGSLGSLVPFLVIIALFWFLFIRPQLRRQREARDMQSSLRIGDHVVLTSGIYGEVAGISENDVMVKFADDVVVRLTRAAIAHVLSQEEVGEKAAEIEAHDDAATMVFGDDAESQPEEGAGDTDARNEPGTAKPTGEEN